MQRERRIYSLSHLNVAHGHVLQHPDAVRPGIVVAGIAAGSVTAHLYLLVERPGQMVTELLAPLFMICLPLLLLLLPAVALTQNLLQHPASAERQQVLSQRTSLI